MSEREIESRNYQDAIVFSEESIVNENWLQKVLAIEFITVKMMTLRQSKKKEHFFEDVNSMY
jgi:hypothetical protein